MTFVKVFPDSQVCFDAIIEVREGPADDNVTLCLVGGGERWAKKEDWKKALRWSSSSIVPAAPGTFALDYLILGEVDIHVDRDPIVAWLTNGHGDTQPIGPRRSTQARLPRAIEFPDGTVRTEEMTYPSRETWTHELLSVWRIKHR